MTTAAALTACSAGSSAGKEGTDSAGGTIAGAPGGRANGDGGHELEALNYEVSDDRYRRWITVQQTLDTLPDLPPPPYLNPDNFSEADVSRAVNYLERSPGAVAALERAGLSARDYVLTTVALDQALVIATRPSHRRYRGLPERNAALAAAKRDSLLRVRSMVRYRVAEHATDTVDAEVIAEMAGTRAESPSLVRAESVGSGAVGAIGAGPGASPGALPAGGVLTPTSTPAVGYIPAGTQLTLRSDVRICTNKTRVGDKVTGTITTPAAGSNGAAIPAGATAAMMVTHLKRSENAADAAVIELVLQAIAFDGHVYPVYGSIASADVERMRTTTRNKDAQKVIGGAIAGAIAGQVLGKDTRATVIGAAAGAAAGTGVAAATANYDACIPTGGAIRVSLPNAVRVRV
ncbi:MAG TPA: hypothetical protein VNA89_06965 [Gemmatimonadaceae bacterium]|nr:hypothetical protein [Gemmatimonadaceae bacterium]